MRSNVRLVGCRIVGAVVICGLVHHRKLQGDEVASISVSGSFGEDYIRRT